MVIKKRPDTATISWIEGGTYIEGRLTGGTEQKMEVPCRIEQAVGLYIDVDNRKLSVSYKVFLDNIDLTQADLSTLEVTISKVKRKILKAVPMQTHLKLFL